MISAKTGIHDFDYLSMYCKKCGRAHSSFVKTQEDCNSGPNVIAVSHIISNRRMKKLISDVEDILEAD